MSMLPCTNCGSRFKGEAQNVYVQHYVKDEVESYRHYLCPDCCEDLMAPVRRQAYFRNADGEWEIPDGQGTPNMLPAPRTGPRLRR